MYRGTLGNLSPTPDTLDAGYTVTNSADSLSALDDKTTHVLVSVDTQSIRVTFDGSDPSQTNGHLWATGYEAVLTKHMAGVMKFFYTGTNGYLHATELAR